MRHIPLAAVDDAASAIYAAAVRTPLVRLDLPFALDAVARPEVYLKLECLQPIGSFKLRGAYNAVRQLSPAQLADGVWTVSAGNAAQGVAFAAKIVGAPCSVMVMDTAPETKVRAIERLGATIVRATYDECWRTVESHGSDRMHGHFVHPFDDDTFIAGNATAGLEILDDLPDVTAVVAAIGGGGLLAGVAAVMAARCRRRESTPPSRKRRRRSPPRWRPASRVATKRGGHRSSTVPVASRCCHRCGRCSTRTSVSRSSCRSTTPPPR